jgi:hypothetical protein
MMNLTPLLAALCLVAAQPTLAQTRPTPGERFLVTWDLDADGTATLAELEEMRGIVFGMFDADADEILTAEEYVAFDEMRAAERLNHQGGGGGQGRGVSARLSDGLALAENDADGDGAVTLAEFIAGAAPWLATIDRDGDGGITLADFAR